MAFWIPLAMAAGSAIAGGISAKKKADEARRIARQNAELGALDTKMSPWVQGNAYKQAVPEAGPGAMGGAFSGALSGFQAGQNVNSALAKQDMYKQLMQKSMPMNVQIPSSAQATDLSQIGAQGGLFAQNRNPYSLLQR